MRRTLTIQEPHHQQLVDLLMPDNGHEQVAYLLCGRCDVTQDPWDGQPARRYFSREVVPIDAGLVLSSSAVHVNAKTDAFVKLLRRCRDESLVLAVVHSHPEGKAEFSAVDDAEEPALVQLAQNRNGKAVEVVSVVYERTGRRFGRVWIDESNHESLAAIHIVGERFLIDFPGRGDGKSSETLARQALAFGDTLNADLEHLRIGIIGSGATGSATAMLLARLGVKRIFNIDPDIVEKTNLNRLHGATMQDVHDRTPKVDVLKRELERLGLDIHVATSRKWVGDADVRDALKSCDVIFGCTDDADGRLLLNRFAYFYLTPVIDMGFQIDVDKSVPPRILEAAGRATVLAPGRKCLLCRGIIDVHDGYADQLRRLNPEEYARRRKEGEQYVRGGGRVDPSVVVFTTDVACMAIDELLHQLTGYRIASLSHRVRKYALCEDKRPGASAKEGCPICGGNEYWGRGDYRLFLDRVG